MGTKGIAWITGGLTLLLTLFSFILSFNALADLAAQHSVSIPPLFPLVVEAGVVIFSLNALYRSLAGESTRWQWALIIGSSLLAGSFNIAHAEADILSRTMAAMPSLFLLLSFETFIGQLKHAAQHSAAVRSLAQLSQELNTKRDELEALTEQKQQELNRRVQDRQAELDRLNSQAGELNKLIEQSRETLSGLRQQIEQAKGVQNSSLGQGRAAKARQDTLIIEQRRTEILNILLVEGDIGASAFANRLNSSRGTVYSDLKALLAAGRIIKNGDGWEVAE